MKFMSTEPTSENNKIFKIKIFSDFVNFFHSYLIYFYTHGISFPENTPAPIF